MKALIDDAVKLGYETKYLLASFGTRGTLFKVIRASRPNWSESQCSQASVSLSRDNVKSPRSFDSRIDYLAYIDLQLTRYAKKNMLQRDCPVANADELSSWQARWQNSRQVSGSKEREAVAA